MENTKHSNTKFLEEQLKKFKLKNYILEEENSLLRENLDCALNENKLIKDQNMQLIKTREEIDKIMSGKIYKILKGIKKITK